MLVSLVPVSFAMVAMVGVGLAVFAHRPDTSLRGVAAAVGGAAGLVAFLGADVVAAGLLATGAAILVTLSLVPGGPAVVLTAGTADRRIVPGVLTALIFAVLIRAVAAGDWSGPALEEAPALAALLGTRLLTTHAVLLVAVILLVIAALVGAYWLHRASEDGDRSEPGGEF